MSFNVLELLVAILFLIWIFNKDKKYPPTRDHPRVQNTNTKYTRLSCLYSPDLFLSIIANKNYYTGLGAIKGWFVVPDYFRNYFL